MNPTLFDFCLFAGGAIGPLVRKMLAKEETWTRQTLAESVLMGFAMILLVGLGLLPEGWKTEALATRPLLTIAGALVVSALAGGGLLYYLTAATRKLFPPELPR